MITGTKVPASFPAIRLVSIGRKPATRDARRLVLAAAACLAALGGQSAGYAAEREVLVLGQGVPISQLTPVPIYQVTMPWVRAIYDALVIWEDGKAVPSLAASWEVSDDFTVYTLKLQPGVTFH